MKYENTEKKKKNNNVLSGIKAGSTDVKCGLTVKRQVYGTIIHLICALGGDVPFIKTVNPLNPVKRKENHNIQNYSW